LSLQLQAFAQSNILQLEYPLLQDSNFVKEIFENGCKSGWLVGFGIKKKPINK